MIVWAVPSSSFAASKPKSGSGSPVAVVKKSYSFLNAGQWDSLDSVIEANYTEHDPDQGQKPGLAGMKEIMKGYASTFPDMKLSVDNIMSNGDLVMAKVTVTGTMTGKMGDAPPNGKKMDVSMYEMFRVKNGKIVERWGLFDSMKMLAQLGMMPAPGAGAEVK